MEAPGSQRKPKRNPVAAWFAEHRRAKKEHDVTLVSTDETAEVAVEAAPTALDVIVSPTPATPGVAVENAPSAPDAKVPTAPKAKEQANETVGISAVRYDAVWNESPSRAERVPDIEQPGTRREGDANPTEQVSDAVGIRASRDDTTRNELPLRAKQRGHDYQHVYTSDNARAHFGDQYIEQQNILSRPADETAEMRKQRFMEDLGFNLMDSRLATIGAAHVDTCDWLFANKAYLRWQDRHLRSSHHGFLWIKGKPGAGKSTLMKHALQHMQRHNQGHHTILSYFFNARGHGLEKTTEGMYRSLLHQVFAKSPRRLPTSVPGYSAKWKSKGWPIPILQDWFRQAVLGFGARRRFICFIDALDECDEESIRLAISNFEELGELAHSRGIHLSICFASRHYPRISVRYHETINLDVESEHQDDVLTFIRRNLHGERSLRRELEMEISKRCSGVFLWAALVVRIVNEKADRGATRSQLLAELSRVPTGIEELLQNMMLHHDTTLLPTLQWVLFSVKPLSVDELYMGVMTSVGHSSVAMNGASDTSETQMRAYILTSSKGLVEFTTITESSSPTAQFIHETVREYLLSGGLAIIDHSLSGDVETISHARLAQWCHDYVKTLPIPRNLGLPFDLYSTRYMLVHMERAFSAKTLDLRPIDAISQRTWLALHMAVNSTFNAWLPDSIEAVNSLYVLILSQRPGLIEAILRRQLACSAQTSEPTPKTNLSRPEISKIPSINVNAVCDSSHCGTALLAAVHRLKIQAISDTHEPECLGTDRVVKLLLRCGANPNLAVVPGYIPLREALDLRREKDHESSLVQLLLQHGADPNIPISNDPDQSVLGLAVKWDKEKVVKMLLRFGANVQGHGTERPLCSAASYSSLLTIRVLLAAKADVHGRDECGSTALHRVIRRKGGQGIKVVIAQELLDAGADVNAMYNNHETTTMLAFRHKQYGLARLLLDRGANPKLPVHRDVARALHSIENGSPDYDADRTVNPEESDDSLTSNASLLPILGKSRA
jgi:ankyrin repeat protein